MLNGNGYTQDTINIKLADGLAFTFTDQRIIFGIKNGVTYNVTGNAASSITSSGGTQWNAFVMGETAGSTGIVNLYVDTTIAIKTSTPITMQGGTALNIYKKFDAAGGTLNITNANINVKTGGTFTAKTLTLKAGSIVVDGGAFNLNSGDSTVAQSLSAGTSLIVNSGTFKHTTSASFIDISGSVVLNSGTMNISSRINRGGNLVANGGSLYSSRSFILNGGTFEYHAGAVGMATAALTANSSIKLYGDLTSGIISVNFRDYTDDGILSLYTNGFKFTTREFYSTTSADVNVNFIIEDGYSWTNNSIHITDMLKDDIMAAINKITIGGVDVDRSNISLVSDGGTGYYVNIIPEPSTWAAIFGALALSLTLYRRRKN